MKKKYLLFILLIILFNESIFSQSILPKREFRGAWIATVINLDWPSYPGLSTDKQKAELITILDRLKDDGINAVIFQIRTECDAFYDSPYEPWSHWLTGKQGQAPSPYYDPLKFAVQEAHKRGMEIHAWFNPFRAVRVVGNYVLSPKHVSVQHPDWILTFGSLKILNPGLPQVRDFITSVITDVVKRYDIDGVHFDDYFYPYEGITNEDAQTFKDYPRGFTNIADWRRDNVNIFIKEVSDSINAVKSYVKFGISPFGIWKSGVPYGIYGLSAYDALYADAVYWLQHHLVDYITPQLYWRFGGNQDYGKLMPWWASQTNGRHLYVGEAPYHIGDSQDWPVTELINQVNANRNNPNCRGSIFFRARAGIMDNEKGFEDSLKNSLYRYSALAPIMTWKDTIPPNPPLQLKYERIAADGRAGLSWDKAAIAKDGDSSFFYVIYKFDNSSITENDLNNSSRIVNVTGERVEYSSTTQNGSGKAYFLVTSLDRTSNESIMSNIIEVTSPSTPLLAFPQNNASNLRDTIYISWNYPKESSSYQIQLSSDSSFKENLVIDQNNYVDTSMIISSLEGQKIYYWRVKANNAAGSSSYSGTRSFTTGFPATPLLASPPDKTTGIKLEPLFAWSKQPAAEAYHLQLVESLYFEAGPVVLDSSGITDTSFSGIELKPKTYYSWRVGAVNQFGESQWSYIRKFQTKDTVTFIADRNIPLKYNLSQNYPNPFNPTTQIDFSIVKAGYTTLKVYDMLGREVATLVNAYLLQGNYKVHFDASKLSSGVYIYSLISGAKSINRKMVVLK